MKTYGIKEGLKNISCLRLFLDHENNVWINTHSKKLYKYITNLDSIVAYKFNYIVKKATINSHNSFEFYVNKQKTLFINTLWDGLTIIYNTGKFEKNHGNNNYSAHIQKIDNYFFYCQETNYNKYGIELINNKPITSRLRGTKNLPFAYEINDELYLLNTDTMTFFVNNTGQIDSNYCSGFVDLKILQSGEFIVARLYNKGVRIFKNINDFKQNISEPLLSFISATRIYVNNDSTIFITSLHDGFYLLKKSVVRSLTNENLINKTFTSLAILNGKIYLVEKEKILSVSNLGNDKYTILYNSKNQIRNMCVLTKNKIIVNQHPNSFYINNGNIVPIYHKIFKKITPLSSSKTEIINSDLLLFLHPFGFDIFYELNKLQILTSYINNIDIDIFSAKQLSKGVYMLGTSNGLKFHENDIILDQYRGLNISTRVNEIEKKNDKFYIATQGAGLYIWDGDQQLDSITADNGILSNTIKQVLADSINIYMSCQGGISVYNLKTKEVRNIEKKHGLLSYQINDMADDGNKIYLATDKGINVMDKNLKDYPLNQPIIESIYVNNKEVNNKSLNLTFDQNNIKINYKTLDYKQKGDITYKCILNNKDSIITKNIDITYPSLSPGTYNFTVQSTNMNGQWGLKREVKFKISPPFWRTISFLTVIGLLFCLLVYLFYRARMKFLKEQLDIQTSLVNLEKSALQAQMNPHFIFNCLNSIQNFINKNNKEEAMEYLSKFAYLIRQMLEASEHSMITLRNEIEMLTNYLELEKLRMNDKFIFNINVDQQIDIKNTIIPVLIIQPYVENAIKHAMNQVADGVINISISKSAEFVNITIEDNGKGFDTESVGQNSKGMKITNSRFENINKLNTSKLNVTVNSSPNGSIIQIKTPLILS